MALIIIVPVAAVGIPVLLITSDERAQIARLEAISEWTRYLAGVLVVGQGLEQALQASYRSAPEAIRPEIAQLVGRLRARWSTETALRAFADDLHDPTGDLVVAALILGARQRGDGLAQVLTGLAESVAENVHARRGIEADRAKPRSSARMLTVICVGTMVVLGTTGQYVAPYGTPLGQLLLIIFLAAFTGCAAWLRRMGKTPTPPRFIQKRVAS
jgi:Flp pilus assembly protein TadB